MANYFFEIEIFLSTSNSETYLFFDTDHVAFWKDFAFSKNPFLTCGQLLQSIFSLDSWLSEIESYFESCIFSRIKEEAKKESRMIDVICIWNIPERLLCF